MLKKIGLTLLSCILAYNSYKLLAIFFKLSSNSFSLTAIIASAVAFNLLITGSFAFLGFVYPTSKLLPNTYYQIKYPERLKSIYKWLGVEYFKYFLLLTFYRKNDNKKYFNGSKAGIFLFDYNTRQSEFGHLLAFFTILILSLILLYAGHKSVFIWIQPMNIIFNLYPIILQRKHRIVVGRLIARI